jgi:hypothetical protein
MNWVAPEISLRFLPQFSGQSSPNQWDLWPPSLMLSVKHCITGSNRKLATQEKQYWEGIICSSLLLHRFELWVEVHSAFFLGWTPIPYKSWGPFRKDFCNFLLILGAENLTELSSVQGLSQLRNLVNRFKYHRLYNQGSDVQNCECIYT